MRTPIAIFVLASGLRLAAQPTVAPANESVGPTRGENTASGYNVQQSFELGYRFHSVGGDADTYRSTVNFGNGVRLLSSSLSVQSLEGHGNIFDQIGLDTQGLGNDPYESAQFRIEKNRLYRYDLRWRSSAYANPGLRTDYAPHPSDTRRNYQDQDLTLFPQSAFNFFVGYSRNTQRGPAITSAQLFNTNGDIYPLLADVNRRQNEYRAGFEGRLKGWRLNVLHGWVNFQEDASANLGRPSDGLNPDDLNTATSFQRTEPIRGNSPYWRVVLFKESRLWSFNGRFTYVSGQRGFVQDSTGFGTDRLGGAITQQVYTSGDARRPAATGSLTISFFPTSKLTLTNQTAISNIRMSGSSVFTQLVNGAPSALLVPYQFLGIRTVSNASDADYRPITWISLHLGYESSSRNIRSQETSNIVPQPLYEQNNVLHVGRAGLRVRPAKGLTLSADSEIGRSDPPFYPVSDRNYEAVRARAEYRHGKFRISANGRTNYNLNADGFANYASHSRQFGGDVTWTASRVFFIDASYMKIHLDTLGVLNYFARFTTANALTGDTSYYVSNLHTANLAAHWEIHQRVDLSLGLSHVQDVGDGRSTVAGTTVYGKTPYLQAAQTFPLRFTSPQGKLSVKLRENLRWNLGYQHYGYAEQFSTGDNFRAHTGYSSVTWAF